jgi:hypothetical protein
MLFDIHAKNSRLEPWNNEPKCNLTASIGLQLKEILWNDTLTYGRARKYHQGKNWKYVLKAEVGANTKFRLRENDQTKINSEDHEFVYFNTDG